MWWPSATAIELEATITIPNAANPTIASSNHGSWRPRGPVRRVAWVGASQAITWGFSLVSQGPGTGDQGPARAKAPALDNAFGPRSPVPGPRAQVSWRDSRAPFSSHLERRETHQHQHHRNDPEAHDHARLGPAFTFSTD